MMGQCRVAFIVIALLMTPTTARKLMTGWEPTPCSEVSEGETCYKLYEHPQGSQLVMPCPVETMGNAEACSAQFEGKADGQQCPQISCPKALGVTMKLVCGGGCCPTCWAPDHVVSLDRHTALKNPATVPAAPQAPGTCAGVKCFKPLCQAGQTVSHVQGDCCYSCVPGR